MRIVLPVSRGFGNLESALSAGFRVFEEYPVDSATIIHVGASNIANKVREILSKATGISIEVEDYSGSAIPELQGGFTLTRELRQRFRDKMCSDRGVVVVSSAGRRLAASIAMAAVSSSCRYDIVHIHFYWGPWTGLAYPYVPRRLEPLIRMHEVHGETRFRNAASLLPNIASGSEGCKMPWGGELPPLRCSVAELARRLNEADEGNVFGPPLSPKCNTFTIEIEVKNSKPLKIPFEPCRPESMARAAGTLAGLAVKLSDYLGSPSMKQLPAWAGVSRLWVKSGGYGELDRAVGQGEAIVDTNLIYAGVHNYALEGHKVLVPECALIEVQKLLAESIKAGRNDPNTFMNQLAYLALQDLKALGTPVLPSGPPPCDIGITRIDLTLLEGRHLATADSGAYNFWKRHPASRIANPLHVYYNPQTAHLESKAEPENPPTIARAYYSLLQMLIALKLAEQQDLVKRLEVLTGRKDGLRKVPIPLATVKSSLGMS